MSRPPKSKLSADIARCQGVDCPSAESCLRYRHREDNHPRLSFFKRGIFIDGACQQLLMEPIRLHPEQ